MKEEISKSPTVVYIYKPKTLQSQIRRVQIQVQQGVIQRFRRLSQNKRKVGSRDVAQRKDPRLSPQDFPQNII